MSDDLTRDSYFNEVRSIAASCVDETLNEDGSPDEDAARERVWETIGSNAYIIWTRHHLDVLKYSDNEDAIEDIGGMDSILKEKGLDGLHAAMAFCAMERDVQDKIGEAIEAAQEFSDTFDEAEADNAAWDAETAHVNALGAALMTAGMGTV